MPQTLAIYIADDCPTCVETRNVVTFVKRRYPNLQIDLLNLSNPDTIYPDNVFATPTFVLDGTVIFLGNPSKQELEERLHKEGIK